MNVERQFPADPANPRRRIPDGMSFGEWIARDGWKLRRFDWPQRGAARGELLFLGGRGDFIEKYLEAFAHWHGRGWNLSGFDWRGQGGSGRLLDDGTICHLDDFDPLLTDLRDFAADWRGRGPGPHVVVAHSMGGHLTLRLLSENPHAFDVAVLASPMLGIKVRNLPGKPLHLAAQAACLFGMAEQSIWRRDPGNIRGRMTSCPDRIADKIWWKSNYPEIASGGPSWGWTRAAFASIARLNASDLESVDTRVLLLGSHLDPIVRIDAISAMSRRLPNAELELYADGGHELLREADAMRLRVLGRIDQFLL